MRLGVTVSTDLRMRATSVDLAVLATPCRPISSAAACWAQAQVRLGKRQQCAAGQASCVRARMPMFLQPQPQQEQPKQEQSNQGQEQASSSQTNSRQGTADAEQMGQRVYGAFRTGFERVRANTPGDGCVRRGEVRPSLLQAPSLWAHCALQRAGHAGRHGASSHSRSQGRVFTHCRQTVSNAAVHGACDGPWVYQCRDSAHDGAAAEDHMAENPGGCTYIVRMPCVCARALTSWSCPCTGADLALVLQADWHQGL
jgi:hypothetical protein